MSGTEAHCNGLGWSVIDWGELGCCRLGFGKEKIIVQIYNSQLV
jgi:hypothetical protein